MTTQPDIEETIEPTSNVLTGESLAITPTASPVKADLFDHSVSWIVAVITLLVVVGLGFTVAFTMGISAQTHEITSTTSNASGACLSVQSFMIHTNEFGEDPALFAKYQAEHPNEKPNDIPCPIVYENNTNHH
jgi:hypothetical protein